ncbi:barttin [Ascaphus truei]|uniref:barttin n=1 Tax=Ascaphus truei TaxID=8439 RepID=UPI003F5A1505
MAEDKTFRYGLIVLGFFLVMIGMFIMSVDKPHVYITFCSLGVLMIIIGITWSICQCYPKITFVPVDMEAEFLTEKSPVSLKAPAPEKQWLTTPYVSSQGSELYETSLPSYEQIQIKVEGPGGQPQNQSASPFLQSMLAECSHPTLQAKVDIHRNSDGSKETSTAAPAGKGDAVCQLDYHKEAPLVSLKEDTNTSSSDASSSSQSSLQSCEIWQDPNARKKNPENILGNPLCDEAFTLIDAPLYEGQCVNVEQDSVPLQNQKISADIQEQFAPDPDPGSDFLIPGHTLDSEADDMYYGMRDEPDNLVTAGESDFEQ